MERRKNNMSILGFGCMRLPKKGTGIDLKETRREIGYAIAHGVNYFDTAYIYPGSEQALGRVLSENGWRDRVLIASKMPHMMIRSMEGLEKLFQEQLARLRTDHIDNYLMHMLPDTAVWDKLCRLGIREWIAEKKEKGQIRHIGFSYHGNTENFIRLLDAYDWEFCQVQYNYMDVHSQAGRRGVRYAASKGIPVIIMEPLRGGRLVNNLPPKARRLFDQASPRRSPADWGLRWLWNQPEVSVVLSGMNSMDMVKENIRIANDVKVGELGPEERKLYGRVRKAINQKLKVPCTGCGYCQPCPAGVDIPGCFRCYNVTYTDNYFTGMREYFMCTTMKAEPTNASRCMKCGRCERHCPQGIAIRDELEHVVRRMENPAYRLGAFLADRIVGGKQDDK